CPSACYCVATPELVQCRYESLDEPPRELPTSVHNLSISGSNLSVLHRAAFAPRPLPDLRLLRLRHDNIQTIEDMALQGLPALRTLHPNHNPLSLGSNPLQCDCALRPLLTWLRSSAARVPDARSLQCSKPPSLRGTAVLRLRPEGLGCSADEGGEAGQLETASYVFFGIVLALIGIVFLMVLYLNRRGIKRWLHNLREACRDQMEGYHYRYEQDADPHRASAVGTPGL
ncbi:trophoblast glycoprotein-like, partial [Meleagris gallopavo]|uniref:trophoblast glycoprotein-like n=1 Tax=Meleagris gallopavo TaxID=9103 RepID=UPI00093EDDF6